MATKGGRTGTTVAHTLRKEPYRFDFFQAVRLLERTLHLSDSERSFRAIGTDAQPNDEIVRFRATAGRTFPPGEIDQLKALDQDLGGPPFEMTVGFMGLFGPSGVLPLHYTQMVIDSVRRRDFALRDFLDVFNHRVISLFFRAWEKYQLPVAYERQALLGRRGEDDFTTALFSNVGFGTGRLRNRFEVDDEAFLYFSGYYSHFPRNAISLECLLGEYFGFPLSVQQFRGQWLYLDDTNCSKMATASRPLGQNCQLGKNFIVGDRVWTVEAGFRIRIGPISYDEFETMMPGAGQLTQLAQLVRTYAGLSLDFDVQPVVEGDSVPPLKLGESANPRLGYNTWLFSGTLEGNVDDAIFTQNGDPTR